MTANLSESLERQKTNQVLFGEALVGLGLPSDASLLSGFYKDDPRNDEGSGEFESQLQSSLESDAETKLAAAISKAQEFDNSPDIFNLWKFTLLYKFLGDLELDTETEIPNSWAELDKFGGDLDECISFLRELNDAVASEVIDTEQYQDALLSVISLYLATALNDEDSEEKISNLLFLVGQNTPIDEVEISEMTAYGSGEHMSTARRMLEEWTTVRLEVPEGLDHEEDAYLDGYDWSTAASEITDRLG